jgi:hypothetical protein
MLQTIAHFFPDDPVSESKQEPIAVFFAKIFLRPPEYHNSVCRVESIETELTGLDTEDKNR